MSCGGTSTATMAGKGPVPFGDPHLGAGAPISIFQQSPGVWAGLTVDRVRVHERRVG